MFCGRDKEIAEAIGVLESGRSKSLPRLILVTGASGAGKSSLVCAGVVPRLDRKKWRIIGPLRPGRLAPTSRLARYVASHPDLGLDPISLRDLILNDPDLAFQELRNAFLRLAHSGGADAAVLLVIDQLEEVFVTDAEGDQDRKIFHSLLRRLAATPDLPLVVLATMRSDVLEAFQRHPDWIDLPRELRQEFTLRPMPRPMDDSSHCVPC
ncbi:MAG: ATP-binding protein [Pirellulales bacterium]